MIRRRKISKRDIDRLAKGQLPEPSEEEFLRQVVILAEAWLADNRADDNELVDSTWLKSVGAVRPQAVAAAVVLVLGEWQYIAGWPERSGGYPLTFEMPRIGRQHGPWQASIFGNVIVTKPTRKWVRDACKVLGVELKESVP